MTVVKKSALIFLLAFISNLIWENLHSLLYANYRGGEITQFILLRATLFDAVFITLLGLLFLGVPYLRKNLWLSIVIGLVAAILIEIYALNTGRWAYNDLMPIIPLLDTGLTPTIQLGLLSYFSYRMVIK
jgi:predicted small integral membrane protein